MTKAKSATDVSDEPTVLGNFVSRAITEDLTGAKIVTKEVIKETQVQDPELLARIKELEEQLAANIKAPEVPEEETTTKSKAK